MTLSLEALPLQYRRFSEALMSLANLVFQERLFPPAHPSCSKALSRSFLYIDTMLRDKDSAVIKLIDGSFYHINFELSLEEYHSKELVFLYNVLSAASIDELQFDEGLTKEELESFAIFMASPRNRSDGIYSSMRDITHIRMRGGKTKIGDKDEVGGRGPEVQQKENFTQLPIDSSRDNGLLHSGKPLKEDSIGFVISTVLDNLDKLKKSEGRIDARKIMKVIDREKQRTSVILLLNSLRNYDEYTFVHSVNVAVISAALAKALGFSNEKIDNILIAGLLHDIGKLYVPKAVLNKKGKLNPMEWKLMRRHPIDGANILKDEGLERIIVKVAFEHHMRYDRNGYPSPRKDYKVTKESDLVRIADTYDAITTKRPYRKQLSPYAAIRFMTNFSGKEFNPDYLDTFVRMMGNVPPGTMVRLNTGEIGVVVDINTNDESPLPRVRLIKDRYGNPVSDEMIINLNEENENRVTRKIVSVIDDAVIDFEIGMYID